MFKFISYELESGYPEPCPFDTVHSGSLTVRGFETPDIAQILTWDKHSGSGAIRLADEAYVRSMASSDYAQPMVIADKAGPLLSFCVTDMFIDHVSWPFSPVWGDYELSFICSPMLQKDLMLYNACVRQCAQWVLGHAEIHRLLVYLPGPCWSTHHHLKVAGFKLLLRVGDEELYGLCSTNVKQKS